MKLKANRTQEGHQYAISRLPSGERFVVIPGHTSIPAEIAALAAGVDAWMSRIECLCRDCRQPFALRDLQGGGQWCNECATKDEADDMAEAEAQSVYGDAQ